jgi:hypothetical protein
MTYVNCSKLFLLLLFGCAACFATAFSSASVTAFGSSCNVVGTTTASCSTADQTGTGGSSATATWGAPGGMLHIIENAGGDTATSATASYSGILIVNGVGGSGSGLLQLGLSGFSTKQMGTGTPITSIPITLQIGSTTIVENLPFGPPSVGFAVTAPVTFGTPFDFSATISANTSGEMFHDGTYSPGQAEAAAIFPTFTVTDNSGANLPNATVAIVPEPASLLLVVCGLLIGLFRFRAASE